MSQRDASIEKAKAGLDEWNAEIDRLQAKAHGAQADARIDYDRKLEEMRRHRDEADERLQGVREASDDAWSAMKAGADEAWTMLSRSLDRAASRLREGLDG